MSKQGLVYCINPEQYDVFDARINKPICIKSIENGVEKGSMVFQEMDEINFRKNQLSYFPPNNVALLLSVNKKHLQKAKELFDEQINPNKVNHSFVETETDKKKFLKEKSKIVADYIELIQTSIVFGYTTLEAFANLSIPIDYEYLVTIKNKGIKEVYDKDAIERWINLGEKLSKILPSIYETKKIEKEKFWSYFIKLEKLRNEIIHQKSITRTEFYKKYFRKDIFDICNVPELVMKFYYEANYKKQRINLLWPWLINKEKEFPITTDFKSENFEVIGNLFEGKKK